MEPCPELIALTQRIYDAFINEPGAPRELFLNDPGTIALGTDEREWWQGYENVVGVLEAQISAVDVQLWTSDGAVAYRHGDVGWCVDNPRVVMADGLVLRMRVTLVFVLHRAQWRIAHWHASIGTANEDLGLDLPFAIEHLADQAEADRPSVAEAVGADGTVTLLFSDIEESTPLLETLGDARYRDLLSWHHAQIRRAVAAHDGSVVSCEGDGFMLAFSSARRAVRCAFDAQAALAAGPTGDLPPVRVRMGIHTGEVLRQEDEFYGRTVHYAARVASRAAGAEVLVSDLVRSLLEGSEGIVVAESRDVELKGFAGTHAVHLVVPA